MSARSPPPTSHRSLASFAQSPPLSGCGPVFPRRAPSSRALAGSWLNRELTTAPIPIVRFMVKLLSGQNLIFMSWRSVRLPLLCLVALAQTSTGRVSWPYSAPGSCSGGAASRSGLHPGSRSSAWMTKAWGTESLARVGRGIPPRFAVVALRGGLGEAPGVALACHFENVVEGSGAACPTRDTHLYIHYTVQRSSRKPQIDSSAWPASSLGFQSCLSLSRFL